MSTASPKQTREQRLMEKFLDALEKKLDAALEEDGELAPAFGELLRKLFADNSITMASVQKGDYGEFAQQVANEFPFQGEDGEDGSPVFN